jgi:Icc-related predicted phosphoesterase
MSIERIKKNYYNYYVIYLIIINVTFYIVFKIINHDSKFSPYSPKITKLIIGNGKTVKIGIISDLQLDKKKAFYSNYSIFKDYSHNVYTSLKFFKKNNIDVIIITGDITNNGKVINYIYFKEIFYLVYNNIHKPILISLMGNHDYFDKETTPQENRYNFYKCMNSYPYSHYIINNYNFIFWSSDNLNIETGIQDYSWIKSTIEEAKKNMNKKGDPIFIITHIPPKHTIYGSDTFGGHQGIYDFLKNYPEVICISGHSHYSLRNIRSIWQGSFTVINTQSLSYVNLEKSFQNFEKVRIDSTKNDSMGLIAYLNEKSVIFSRVEFSTGEVLDERWKIDFPIDVNKFKYNFEKRNKKIKPIFTSDNNIKIEKEYNRETYKRFIVFNSASHCDYVYIYKIVLMSLHFVF